MVSVLVRIDISVIDSLEAFGTESVCEGSEASEGAAFSSLWDVDACMGGGEIGGSGRLLRDADAAESLAEGDVASPLTEASVALESLRDRGAGVTLQRVNT